MSLALLSTKLHIPHTQTNAVSRPRLTEKLLAGVKHLGSLVLLSGPAGFGKTTLLSEAAVDLGPVAWVSLDETDNDPNRFWTYLLTACRSVQPKIGESGLALLQTPQPLPGEIIPTVLINDLVRLGTDLIIVLDDYHTIQNLTIHSALAYLLDHIPDNLHLVISTRVDPPWSLARFRARGQLIEIRAVDLRFTTEETSVFLNQVIGADLSAEHVAALEERMEGCVAGLQLAALSMKGRSDIAGFIKALTGSHVYLAEYLLEEVLKQQSEEMQTFLLQTSILERLSAGLCETVTECQDGQARLMALQRANIFLFPLDDKGCWFRYHHLFADLLQARLRQDLLADGIARLHQRAASWYEPNSFTIEAVDHLLAAGDFEEAARLVEQNTFSLMTRGELTTLLRWIDALPPDLTLCHPSFLLAKAWVLTFAGAAGQVETLLQQVEAQIEREGETRTGREIQGNVTALRAFFTLMAGDDERALALAERAETLLPANSPEMGQSNPYTLAAHSVLPYTLGMAYRSRGQYEKAAEVFVREVRTYTAPESMLTWTIATIELAITRRLQGRLRESGDVCRKALQRIADQGSLPFGPLARLDTVLGDILREQNVLDEAYRRASGALERVQSWAMPTDRLTFYLTLMRVQEAQSDLAGAYETLRLAKELKAAHPVFMDLARMVDLYEIRLALANHEFVTADRLMNGLQPRTSRSVFLRDQELILLARLRLAQGRLDEALAICSPLAGDAEETGRMYAWLETLTVQACALDASANREAALKILIEALKSAEPQGFARVFLDQGEAMHHLLATLGRQLSPASDPVSITLKGYVAKLLNTFGAVSYPFREINDLVNPLTTREMEVLQLMAAGDSNKAIADKLVITVRSVKKHTGNIYGKLNVRSRTQAVARARQLGLLPTD